MPLTPEDVSNKRFTPVRLREGYDMSEVDQFLDEVESELVRLTRDNQNLRSKLGAAQRGGPVAVDESDEDTSTNPSTDTSTDTETAHEAAPEPEPTPEPAPVAAAPQPPSEQIRVTTVADASSAAARLLELATRNADELVTEAKEEADKIAGEARTRSERLDVESKEKADRLESDARTRAQMLDSETEERRQQLFGDLEKDRDKLNVEVENLRSFEREYRSRLKSYFEQQLSALAGGAEPDAPAGDEHAPKRLRSLLAEDGEQPQEHREG